MDEEEDTYTSYKKKDREEAGGGEKHGRERSSSLIKSKSKKKMTARSISVDSSIPRPEQMKTDGTKSPLNSKKFPKLKIKKKERFSTGNAPTAEALGAAASPSIKPRRFSLFGRSKSVQEGVNNKPVEIPTTPEPGKSRPKFLKSLSVNAGESALSDGTPVSPHPCDKCIKIQRQNSQSCEQLYSKPQEEIPDVAGNDDNTNLVDGKRMNPLMRKISRSVEVLDYPEDDDWFDPYDITMGGYDLASRRRSRSFSEGLHMVIGQTIKEEDIESEAASYNFGRRRSSSFSGGFGLKDQETNRRRGSSWTSEQNQKRRAWSTPHKTRSESTSSTSSTQSFSLLARRTQGKSVSGGLASRISEVVSPPSASNSNQNKNSETKAKSSGATKSGAHTPPEKEQPKYDLYKRRRSNSFTEGFGIRLDEGKSEASDQNSHNVSLTNGGTTDTDQVIFKTVVTYVCFSLTHLLLVPHICQLTGLALVQMMACRLFGAKPSAEPMLSYCQMDP